MNGPSVVLQQKVAFFAASTPLPAGWVEGRTSRRRRKSAHSQHDELAAAVPAVRHLITVIVIYQISELSESLKCEQRIKKMHFFF